MNASRPSPILVTGAAGLIGSEVIQQLLARGTPVIALDRDGPQVKGILPDGLIWEQINLTDPGLEARLGMHNPSAVVHCAAHPGGRSLEEPSLDVQINAHGSMRVFEFCAHADIPVIYLSSSVIYADQPPGLIGENAKVAPGTVYGACKVACENFLRILEAGYGLKWTVLRLFATYGAGHKPSLHQGIVNIMLTQMLNGNRIVSKGSLKRARDMIYVEDAAAAIVKCLDAPQSRGQIINVGTGSPVTILELIHALARVFGRPIEKLEIVEEEGTVGDPFNNSADITKAQELLGYAPRYDLNKGLTELNRRRQLVRGV